MPRLWGRALRFVVVDHLMAAGGVVSVAELVEVVAAQGFRIEGRPSKVISDGLRWEVARGRVVRLGRGRYRYRTAPASTARRIRILADVARRWVAARLVGGPPPRLPPDRRSRNRPVDPPHNPIYPPWASMNWLWGT